MKQKLTLTENDYKIIIKVNAFVEKVLKSTIMNFIKKNKYHQLTKKLSKLKT